MAETFNKQPDVLKGYNMMLYFAGTMIMFDPSTECIHDFWTQRILKSLPVSSNNPRFIKAASQLHQSVDDQTSTIKMMREDYLTLFAGKGNPLAPPIESAFRSTDTVILNNNKSEVSVFYQSYGWESKFKETIPEDHLGIELLFLTIMIEKYLEFDDEFCDSEMRTEIRRFIDQHLLSWLPNWNTNMQKHAKTLSYKGIGTLILACVEDIYNTLGQDGNNPN